MTLPFAQKVIGMISPPSWLEVNSNPYNNWLPNIGFSTFAGQHFISGLHSWAMMPEKFLIEGKSSGAKREPWLLLDECTVYRFNSRSRVYFSYPREVKQLRITVQKWRDWNREELLDKPSNGLTQRHSNGDLWLTLRDFIRFNPNDQQTKMYNSLAGVNWCNMLKAIYIPPLLFFGEK